VDIDIKVECVTSFFFPLSTAMSYFASFLITCAAIFFFFPFLD